MKLHYGPRRATWFVTLLDTRSVTLCSSLPAAESEIAYWRVEGRSTALSYLEACAQPGCDSAGTIYLAKPRASRGVRYASKPCPQCAILGSSEIIPHIRELELSARGAGVEGAAEELNR